MYYIIAEPQYFIGHDVCVYYTVTPRQLWPHLHQSRQIVHGVYCDATES